MSNKHNNGERYSVIDKESIENNLKLELNSSPPARIKNPLAGISRTQLLQNVEEFAEEKGLIDILPILSKGAVRELLEIETGVCITKI